MSLSPLAAQIYQTLVRQLRLPNPLISYGDLVRALGPLPPPYASLKPNDLRLFEALGEVSSLCQSNTPPLPALTSIVVRRNEDGSLGTPGPGYFSLVFPHVREGADRLQMWRDEVRRIKAASYPEVLISETPTSKPAARLTKPPAVPRWLREPTVIAAVIGLAGTLLAVIIPVWISSRHAEPLVPIQPARVVVEIAPQNSKPVQPPQADPPAKKTAPEAITLDEVLDVLERHHQRATFGAVGGILERDPRSLFNGYVRSPKTSWVVSKSTGLPTGTKDLDYPPGLLENKRVIDAPNELRVWLREHQ